MECLYDNEVLLNLLVQYGSLMIFVLLVLGIIALPIPEETILVVAGFLMNQEVLSPSSTILAGFAGSMSGISLSYLLGRTGGSYLIHNYGSWVGLKQSHLQRAKEWFNHFGKWSLFIGYFIPGVRHFTGFTAGSTNVEYKHFALYAYSGAVIWVITFLGIGYFFGSHCLGILESLDFGVVLFVAILVALIVLYVIIAKFLSSRLNRK